MPDPSRTPFKLPYMMLASFYPSAAGLLWRAGTHTPRETALAVLLGCALLALSLIDHATYRLPDALTLPLAFIGCLTPQPPDQAEIAWRAASALAGFLSFVAVADLYRRSRGVEGLGPGDAKLLAAAGAWLGMERLPMMVLAASALALASAALVVLSGRKMSLNSRLAFGPFLAAAFWLMWLDEH